MTLAASIICVLRLPADQHYLFVSFALVSPSITMDVDVSYEPVPQVTSQEPGDENASPDVADLTTSVTAQTTEKWTKTIHPRGRQARDPLAQYVRYDCNGADQMEEYLRSYLADPTSPAEHTTVIFSFSTSSAFMVYAGDYSGGSVPKTNLYGTLNRSALSVDAALAPPDKKESLKKQKSIAKTLIEHVQKADGFRYSFHNNWLSKDDEAHRFSYFCNDSTLNKGRAANEGAGMEHKRKMKPVYDCSGTIHVKFSVTKQSLELHYKHIPCHQTYEERAPPPRKNSKRRKIMEVFEPEKLIRERKRKEKALKPPRSPKLKGRPRRRATEPLTGSVEDSTDPSAEGLAPLIDFLGSAEREANGDQEVVAVGQDGEPLPASREVEKRKQSRTPRKKSNAPRQGVVRPPSLQVPGMMSGYLSGDLITWGSRSAKRRRTEENSSTTIVADSLGPLAGIAQAAAEVQATQSPAGMSEIELLKAKLAAAEARINRLESEKTTPGSSTAPIGWRQQPQRPSPYMYPPPQFGNVPFTPVTDGPPNYGFLQPPTHQTPHTQSKQKAQQPKKRGELRTIHYDPNTANAAKVDRQIARNTGPGEALPSQVPPSGGQILEM